MIEIKKSLTAPFRGMGKITFYALILILGTVLVFIGAGLGYAKAFLDIGSIANPLRIALVILAMLLYFPSTGYITRIFKTGELPPVSFGKSFLTGVKLVIVLIAYSIPYDLTLFVPGTIGVILSAIIILLAFVFLPAIFLNVAQQNSILAGFKWNQIIRKLSKNYAIAYGISLLVLVFYTFLPTGLLTVLFYLPMTTVLYYIIVAVNFVLTVFLQLIMLSTIASLFAASSGSVSEVETPPIQ